MTCNSPRYSSPTPHIASPSFEWAEVRGYTHNYCDAVGTLPIFLVGKFALPSQEAKGGLF